MSTLPVKTKAMMRNDVTTRPDATAQAPDDATTHTLLKSALRIAGLGCWTWNLSTGEMALSAEAQGIFGEAGPLLAFESWLRRVDPADAARLPALEEAIRGRQRTFSFEYRFTNPDGARRRLKSDGEVVSVDGVIVLSVRNDTLVLVIVFEINDLRIQFVRRKSKFVSPCRITTFRTRAHRFAR